MTGRGLFGAIRIYNAQWNFNSGLFHWLELGLGEPGYSSPSSQVRIIAGAILAAVCAILWWRGREVQSRPIILRLMALPFMAFLLLSPTVHPWYLLILLAFLPFLPPGSDESPRWWLVAFPWIYLSGAIVFSYLTYQDAGHFFEREWVRLLEWVPTLLLGGAASLAMLKRKWLLNLGPGGLG